MYDRCKKCSELPPDDIDPKEALELAQAYGWTPAIVILVKEDEEGKVDFGHLHYLWRVSEGMALRIVLGIVPDLIQVAEEEEMRRARRN